MAPLLVPMAVTVVVSIVALRRAHRPDPGLVEEWATAHGLELDGESRPMVARYLRTSGILRTWGAVGGLFLPPLVELAWSGRPRVLGLASDGFQFGDLSWIFVGYLAGALLSELALARPASPGRRSASLVRRELADYLPARLLWAQRILGCVGVVGALALGVFGTGVDIGARWPAAVMLALLFCGLSVGLERLQRWLVTRPQPYTSQSLVAADDAIRSQAVHSLAGSGLALLLLSLSGLALVHAAAGGVVAVAMAMVGLPAFLLAVVSCQYYGHRAWRVRRPAVGVSPAAGGTGA